MASKKSEDPSSRGAPETRKSCAEGQAADRPERRRRRGSANAPADEALRESERRVRRKLDAILAPEADVGALELSDIIDCESLQKLMDQFYRLTRIGIGIIDLRGRVLVGTGWQEICTQFHRINPESCRLCVESDLQLSRGVPAGTFRLYRCKNNMWHISTPVVLGDKHVGNIFLGQFLFDDEKPDYETFRQQARRFGFDEVEYLAALDRVPRWSRDTVDAAMSFYTAFAGMIVHLSYSNVELAGALADRNRAEEERVARVHFLESLDRVNQAIQQATDVEEMLWDVAEATLSVFRADRAWLLYPCNPNAPSFRVPVECTRTEYPGACALDLEMPMSPGQARDMRDALASDDPACYTLGSKRPVSEETARQFGVQAQMFMAVYPKTGEPWMFGMHQCSHARVWTEDERRLFKQIGRRIGDALGELLVFRDLRESEKQYRDLVDRMIDVIYALDCRGIVTSVNPAIETLLGFTPEEVVGTHFGVFLDEESRPRAQEAFERVLREGEATDTTVMVDRTGGLHYVEFASSAIEQDGRVVGTRGMIRDVTDRKRAEDLVRAQRNLGEALGATSSLDEGLRLCLETAIRVAQMDCGGVYLADEFSGALKLVRHQGLSAAFVASVSEFAADSPNTWITSVVAPLYTDVLTFDAPPDEARQNEGLRAMAMLPVRHEDRVIGYMGVASHVLEEVPAYCRPALETTANQMGSAIARLKAEQALRDSEQRYRNLVENSTYGVVIHQDTEVLYVNRAAVDMLGYASPREILGRSVLDFVHPSGRAGVVARVRKALEWGEPAPPAEERFLAKDGRVVDVEVTGTRMTYRGRPAVQAAFVNVTERRRAEERLRQMEMQLAHVSRVSAMGEMVAGVAHEISQPLYAVMNFAKASGNCLAAEGELDVKTLREWNHAIVEAAGRAGEIIQRLRDFARRAPPIRGRVDANDAVHEAVELLAFEARHRGIDVSLHLSETAPSVSADRVQIQQVLVNLLQNALEALGDGVTGRLKRVTIRTRLSKKTVTISVADNGTGLPLDESKIFDPFVTTKPDGLGIGLAISRTIVEAHDGRLWATSNPDGGATFHLTLPVAGGQDAH